MPLSFAIYLSIFILSAALTGCSGNRVKQESSTGLAPLMTVTETLNIMGTPDTIKPAGKNKEIYIYRRKNEIISIFFIAGKIKNIEHIARDPRIKH